MCTVDWIWACEHVSFVDYCGFCSVAVFCYMAGFCDANMQ